MRSIPRVEARTCERCGRISISAAARELHHRELANENRAGAIQLIHDGSVLFEHLAGEGFGPPSSGVTLHGEQILHRVRDSLERSALAIALQIAIDIFRLADRGV